jgi:hypothetical protein
MLAAQFLHNNVLKCKWILTSPNVIRHLKKKIKTHLHVSIIM